MYALPEYNFHLASEEVLCKIMKSPLYLVKVITLSIKSLHRLISKNSNVTLYSGLILIFCSSPYTPQMPFPSRYHCWVVSLGMPEDGDPPHGFSDGRNCSLLCFLPLRTHGTGICSHELQSDTWLSLRSSLQGTFTWTTSLSLPFNSLSFSLKFSLGFFPHWSHYTSRVKSSRCSTDTEKGAPERTLFDEPVSLS